MSNVGDHMGAQSICVAVINMAWNLGMCVMYTSYTYLMLRDRAVVYASYK